MKNISNNLSSMTTTNKKSLTIIKQPSIIQQNNPYNDGHQEMGVSHLRKRNTQQEMTASKTVENIDKLGETTIYDLNTSLNVHKPGRNFNSVNKRGSDNVKKQYSHAVHHIDTGTAHKSLRALVNLKTQIEMKSANKNENIAESILY